MAQSLDAVPVSKVPQTIYRFGVVFDEESLVADAGPCRNSTTWSWSPRSDVRARHPVVVHRWGSEARAFSLSRETDFFTYDSLRRTVR